MSDTEQPEPEGYPSEHREGAASAPSPAAVTKADLAAAVRGFEQRLGEIGACLDALTSDSGDITQQIMGDLAGIRAEQMHLDQCIEALRVDIRADIRAEIKKALAGHEHKPRSEPRRRIIWVTAFAVLLLLLLLLLALLAQFWSLRPGP